MSAWLNAPIPRKYALGALLITNASLFLTAKSVLREGDKIIADQNERLHILKESVDFLLDQADDATIIVLNQNLDFWRVVREMEPRKEPS